MAHGDTNKKTTEPAASKTASKTSDSTAPVKDKSSTKDESPKKAAPKDNS